MPVGEETDQAMARASAGGGPRRPERQLARPAGGFYEEESDGVTCFRWMRRAAALALEPTDEERFVELSVLSELGDLSQELHASGGGVEATLPLPRGWSRLSIIVPAGTRSIALDVGRIFPRSFHPGDDRELVVRVQEPRVHADPHRHRAVSRQHANAVLNQREMLAGAIELCSTPVSLGIDLHGACNVNPPCVFCEWDAMKALEGDNARTRFTPADLAAYGALYDHAAVLVNCSIGEPFMMHDLDALLDTFGRDAKTVEMSTNGQILTERTIAALLGRDIHLYVSIDAAHAETYARLRNDGFGRVIANVRRLVEAKGGRGRLPFVYLVFMPMMANAGELPDFVHLCADLAVDALVLRPLNPETTAAVRWTRAGYTFHYRRELPGFDELIRLSGEADELCRSVGVPLANQLDFGGSTGPQFRALFEQGRRRARDRATSRPALGGTAASRPEPAVLPRRQPAEPSPPREVLAPIGAPSAAGGSPPLDPQGGDGPADLGLGRWPACTEPWRTLYILRRGVLPCCYGGHPIAAADGYHAAWNGPIVQAIRRSLAAGRFHEYCLRSPLCPIVAKGRKSGALPRREALMLAAHHAWQTLNRLTLNVPRLLFRPIKPAAMRVLRRLSLLDPDIAAERLSDSPR
jgi:hypothetical protein